VLVYLIPVIIFAVAPPAGVVRTDALRKVLAAAWPTLPVTFARIQSALTLVVAMAIVMVLDYLQFAFALATGLAPIAPLPAKVVTPALSLLVYQKMPSSALWQRLHLWSSRPSSSSPFLLSIVEPGMPRDHSLIEWYQGQTTCNYSCRVY
jgi:hypothetical protein